MIRGNSGSSGVGGKTDHVFQVLPSPRLISTHIPYSLLPHGITKESSGCRIVYICRDSKDTMVSQWHFNKKTARDLAIAVPHVRWRHALEYWEESKTSRESKQVLFLRYEEIMQDPVGNLKKLADFMGCGFSTEEEEARVPQKIVDLCSLEKLKGSDVNKNGVVGDWRNHMTPEMAARLDRVVDQALQGSGLTLSHSM
ncbi:hypothetical protein HU200_007967 [Digitaria exilis]|uniref:Sulfotransferase n=1 Tax=Digitaria exilis TaxID=1010633 RepID=A0A835KS10_9POAL|nr:hypothetical protein HU200_007967 [Digitaria exilis]